MIKTFHKKKEFCVICYGIDPAQNFDIKGKYEFECTDDEIEKMQMKVQEDFDNGLIAYSDYEAIQKQLLTEHDNLDE